MFTDADFKAPTLSKVIVFPYGEYVDTEDARTEIRNEERRYGRSYESVEAYENLHGPGYITEYTPRDFPDNGWQISRGTGKNGSGVDSQSGSGGIRHRGEGGLRSGSEVDNKISSGAARRMLVDTFEEMIQSEDERKLVDTYRQYLNATEDLEAPLVEVRKQIAEKVKARAPAAEIAELRKQAAADVNDGALFGHSAK